MTDVQDPSELRMQLARRDRELRAVHRITAALHAQTDLDALVQQTLLAAIDTAEASAGSVLLPDAEGKRLVFRYVVSESAEVTGRLACRDMPSDQGLAGRVFQCGQGVISNQIGSDAQHYQAIDRETHQATRNMITVPLCTRNGRPLGVMQVLNRRTGSFCPEDLQVLEILAAQAAAAMETAALHSRLLEGEVEKKRFYGEVIRCVTGGKLCLVEADEVPSEGQLALKIPLDGAPAYSQLRKQLLETSESAGMSRERAEDFALAVGEAATNAIKHATQGHCAAVLTDDRLIARVTDRGQGIRTEDLPATLLQPGFSTKISLGMGYTLMLEMADRIWLATGGAGTVVQLEKWLQPREEASGVEALLDRF